MNRLFGFGDDCCVCLGFRSVAKLLGRKNIYCKGDSGSVKETMEEKAFAEVAAQRFNFYKENFQPLEEKYMSDVEALDTDAARDFATGTAGSATSTAFDGARKQTSDALVSHGINPASGKYQSKMSGLADAQGMASTENQTMASNSVDDQYIGGLQNISAIGKGQATTAQAGLSDLADGAANKATSDAYNAFNKKAGTLNAVGSAVGLASYGLNSGGKK